MKWYKADKELPVTLTDNGAKYMYIEDLLIVLGGRVYVGNIAMGNTIELWHKWEHSDGSTINNQDAVTHWGYLPKAPKL